MLLSHRKSLRSPQFLKQVSPKDGLMTFREAFAGCLDDLFFKLSPAPEDGRQKLVSFLRHSTPSAVGRMQVPGSTVLQVHGAYAKLPAGQVEPESEKAIIGHDECDRRSHLR